VSVRIARATSSTFGLVEIAEASRHLFRGLSRDALDSSGEAIVRRIEAADVLVVGTPVYRGSYTGALKHLFDLVDHRALAGKRVVLAATGGSRLHGLVIEHQLRPLFGFFGALTAPTTIYGAPEDFDGAQITSAELWGRIDRAAEEAVALSAFATAPRERALSGAAR
jgi:FMN reductase